MSLTKDCKATALEAYVERGLAALGQDKGHVLKEFHPRCHESLNFEKYVKNGVSHNVSTWDYIVSAGTSLKSAGLDALEVHPCDPTEAKRVVAKKVWSEDHLAACAPKVHIQRWVWIASGASSIIEGISPEHFELSQAGIELATKKGYAP